MERRTKIKTAEEFLNIAGIPIYVKILGEGEPILFLRLTQTKISLEVNEALCTDILRRYDLTESLSQLGNLSIEIVQGRYDPISPEDLQTTLLPWLSCENGRF